MSFFGRILSQFVSDVAVNKLASSKTFQQIAVRTVDAHKALQEVARKAAEDPHSAKEGLTRGATTLFQSLRAEMQKDLQRLHASLTEEAPAASKSAAKSASVAAMKKDKPLQ